AKENVARLCHGDRTACRRETVRNRSADAGRPSGQAELVFGSGVSLSNPFPPALLRRLIAPRSSGWGIRQLTKTRRERRSLAPTRPQRRDHNADRVVRLEGDKRRCLPHDLGEPPLDRLSCPAKTCGQVTKERHAEPYIKSRPVPSVKRFRL